MNTRQTQKVTAQFKSLQKMPKTTAKKSTKNNPKKTAKSVTTERRVTCDRRIPQNTRQRQEVVEPVRKHIRRDTDNADAVPPKWPRSSRSLTEADIPHIVDAFIAAQDKCHRRRPTRDSDAKDGHLEDDPSDSVSDLGNSGGELLTDEDLSGKNVARTRDVEQL